MALMCLLSSHDRFQDKWTIHQCSCCVFKDISKTVTEDSVIVRYYSVKEAQEAGWNITNHRYYSKDGSYAWVCPDCVNKKPEAFK